LALAMAQKVVAARSDDGPSLDTLGWILYQLGRYDDAVPRLCQAAILDPGTPEIHIHLGDAYWRVGLAGPARLQWQQALALAVERRLHLGQEIETAEPRGGLAVGDLVFLAELPDIAEFAIPHRDLAGDEGEPAGEGHRHVVGDRYRCLGQLDPELGEALVD